MKRLTNLFLLSAVLVLSSFTSPVKSARQAAFLPQSPTDVTSLTGTWVQSSNPYIQFVMTLAHSESAITNVYLDITYYTDPFHTVTTTLSFVEFPVAANSTTAYLQWELNPPNGFYGVKSYTVYDLQ